TLYRHFPSRQALLEALYVNEVQELARSAEQLEGGDPWQSLNGWFERLIGYLATKRALAAELTNYLDPSAPLFQTCRASLFAAGASCHSCSAWPLGVILTTLVVTAAASRLKARREPHYSPGGPRRGGSGCRLEQAHSHSES